MLDALKLVKTPAWLPGLFPGCSWNGSRTQKNIYLTFDDGPIPGPTEFVLDQLRKHQQKATFFCVGDNVNKHPDLFTRILAEGHAVGNHTFNHLNGWKTGNSTYFENILQCAEAMESRGVKTKLFRPPYGKLTLSQYQFLQNRYKIIMWDVLPYDFDTKLTADEVWLHASKHTGNGTVIVFHDSLKAFPRLEKTLPRYLEFLAENQWQSQPLPAEGFH